MNRWKRNSTPIGQVQSETFKVVIEIESDRTKPLNKNAYVAIDNLTLDNCFEENNQSKSFLFIHCFIKSIFMFEWMKLQCFVSSFFCW
jgi:hypothetical protein